MLKGWVGNRFGTELTLRTTTWQRNPHDPGAGGNAVQRETCGSGTIRCSNLFDLIPHLGVGTAAGVRYKQSHPPINLRSRKVDQPPPCTHSNEFGCGRHPPGQFTVQRVSIGCHEIRTRRRSGYPDLSGQMVPPSEA
jgi:hypothetical protein